MPAIAMRVIGDAAYSAWATGRAAGLDGQIYKTTGLWGHRLETQIKANASGRPGPRAITGNYRRSWNTQMTKVGGGAAAIVGTAAPQGRRLEMGFVGVDSLGRHYNQPPFPHVRPAMQQIEPGFVQAMRKILD
jgi:hypothetical protein